MGFNRLYTYNGQIIKTASGNPVGFEYGAPPAAPYPTDGLVARYTFDDSNYNDSHGSYDGTGDATFDTGKVSNAAKFIGTSKKYVNTGIPNTTFINRNPWSISFWFKLNPTQVDYATFMSNYKALGNKLDYGISLTYRTTKISVSRYGTGGLISGTVSYGDNNWHMLVVSYDGTNLKFNVDNGSEVVSSTNAVNPQYGPGDVTYIGCDGTRTSGYIGSLMDQVYIYNRAITDTEIAQLWNNGNGI